MGIVIILLMKFNEANIISVKIIKQLLIYFKDSKSCSLIIVQLQTLNVLSFDNLIIKDNKLFHG